MGKDLTIEGDFIADFTADSSSPMTWRDIQYQIENIMTSGIATNIKFAGVLLTNLSEYMYDRPLEDDLYVQYQDTKEFKNLNDEGIYGFMGDRFFDRDGALLFGPSVDKSLMLSQKDEEALIIKHHDIRQVWVDKRIGRFDSIKYKIDYN